MDLLIDRRDLRRSRIIETAEARLEPGQARLEIERFALSANNVSYAAIGDMLGYWTCFPAEDPWGRVPVWGYARVIESNHDQVEVGSRFFGFLPMSERLVISVGAADASGISDASGHRASLAPTYNRYTAVHPGDDGPADEDRRMLLYGLYVTAFLVVDFLADNDWFGAEVLVVSSASAKTALGIAHRAAQLGGVEITGLTSPGNLAFTEERAVYDQVLTYDSIHDLPIRPTAYVDVSGSGSLRAGLHQHLGPEVRHDMILGATHWEATGAPAGPLAGADPAFFFAPTQISRRSEQWGRDVLDQTMASAWSTFAPWTADWITLRRTGGLQAAAETFTDLLENQVDPTIGHIISPNTG